MTPLSLWTPVGATLAWLLNLADRAPLLRPFILLALFVALLPFANWGKLPCWLLSPCGQNMGRPQT